MHASILAFCIAAGLGQTAPGYPGFTEPNFQLELVEETLNDRVEHASFASAANRYSLWSSSPGSAPEPVSAFDPDPQNPMLGQAHLMLPPGDYRIMSRHGLVPPTAGAATPGPQRELAVEFTIEPETRVQLTCSAHGLAECAVRKVSASSGFAPWR